MITPRRTRLVRVHDLHEFRRTLVCLAADGRRRPLPPTAVNPAEARCAIVVPTRGAAVALERTLRAAGHEDVPLLLTRDQLYDVFHARLEGAPRRLTAFERDAIALAAAEEAARDVGVLPFKIRPGLVAEILRFYDHLRRQSQPVVRFEALIVGALGGDEGGDRGAERLLLQTRFLAGAFRAYEQRVRQSGACDEHGLRERIIADPAPDGLQSVVVTVSDWIADPTGIFVADFDVLARVPRLETLDIVCTDALLGSGFHERIHSWWPGLEEVSGAQLAPAGPRVRPMLIRPPVSETDCLWFAHRDREEELAALARRLADPGFGGPAAWESTAVVYKRPLPYLYLAPDTLGDAGVAYQMSDALPLAAEPLVTALDLVLDAVETGFSREALVALLASPHLRFGDDPGAAFRESVSEMNGLLSRERYLGGLDRLGTIAQPPERRGVPALLKALEAARELAPLLEVASASRQLRTLIGFLDSHWCARVHTDREQQVREVVMRILRELADAHASHHDPVWGIDDLANAVRRWIEDETFPVASESAGVHLVDDQAARYGEFADVTIVGLIENEWPDRPRRNIFYAPGLLKALGWPSEKDRRAAADARFIDLLVSSSSRVELSTFMLEDEALVTRSLQLDEVPRAKLSTLSRDPTASLTAPEPDDAPASTWAALRRERSPAGLPEFHGSVGPRPGRPWSVSALETYLGCPFKFFAQHVLKLDEEPDDEEVMDPRRQGLFMHEVFERFFKEWQGAGHCEVTAANLATARDLFVGVVDRALERLPEGEAALERTRLLGSSAAAGLGDAVFRMEAERSVPVVERLLEHSLSGRFTFASEDGPREVELRGKADRVDLLADGTFRLVDYKLGWPPDRSRALQLPIYGICAEQRLEGHRGRHWTLAEAVYLAFKGPRRVVPLFQSAAARHDVLAKAQQRLVEALDAIARGQFPPTPDDVYRCDTCSFQSVCRKDYVGHV